MINKNACNNIHYGILQFKKQAQPEGATSGVTPGATPSIWDNIQKGLKKFMDDPNGQNALISGGIGAGLGGLIDGWRGAGIGALGGGVLGYNATDIKDWVGNKKQIDALTEQNKKTQEALAEQNKTSKPTQPQRLTKEQFMAENQKQISYDDIPINKNDIYEKMAYALIRSGKSIEELNGMSSTEKNNFFRQNNISEDNNWFFDAPQTDIADGNYPRHKYIIEQKMDEIRKKYENAQNEQTTNIENRWNALSKQYADEDEKTTPEYTFNQKAKQQLNKTRMNEMEEYNKQHPSEALTYTDENYKKFQDWKKQQQQKDNARKPITIDYSEKINNEVTPELFGELPDYAQDAVNAARKSNSKFDYDKAMLYVNNYRNRKNK